MEMIKVRALVEHDGLLKLEIPTGFADVELEIALVMQPVERQAEGFLPANFFEMLDAIEADDLQERPEQALLEVRDEIE